MSVEDTEDIDNPIREVLSNKDYIGGKIRFGVEEEGIQISGDIKDMWVDANNPPRYLPQREYDYAICFSFDEDVNEKLGYDSPSFQYLYGRFGYIPIFKTYQEDFLGEIYNIDFEEPNYD